MARVLAVLAGVNTIVRNKCTRNVLWVAMVSVSASKGNVFVHPVTTAMRVKKRTTCAHLKIAMDTERATLRSVSVTTVGKEVVVTLKLKHAPTVVRVWITVRAILCPVNAVAKNSGRVWGVVTKPA